MKASLNFSQMPFYRWSSKHHNHPAWHKCWEIFHCHILQHRLAQCLIVYTELDLTIYHWKLEDLHYHLNRNLNQTRIGIRRSEKNYFVRFFNLLHTSDPAHIKFDWNKSGNTNSISRLIGFALWKTLYELLQSLWGSTIILVCWSFADMFPSFVIDPHPDNITPWFALIWENIYF